MIKNIITIKLINNIIMIIQFSPNLTAATHFKLEINIQNLICLINNSNYLQKWIQNRTKMNKTLIPSHSTNSQKRSKRLGFKHKVSKCSLKNKNSTQSREIKSLSMQLSWDSRLQIRATNLLLISTMFQMTKMLVYKVNRIIVISLRLIQTMQAC